jgi:hypothetical protein
MGQASFQDEHVHWSVVFAAQLVHTADDALLQQLSSCQQLNQLRSLVPAVLPMLIVPLKEAVAQAMDAER